MYQFQTFPDMKRKKTSLFKRQQEGLSRLATAAHQAPKTTLKSDRPTRCSVIFKDESQLYKVAGEAMTVEEERVERGG